MHKYTLPLAVGIYNLVLPCWFFPFFRGLENTEKKELLLKGRHWIHPEDRKSFKFKFKFWILKEREEWPMCRHGITWPAFLFYQSSHLPQKMIKVTCSILPEEASSWIINQQVLNANGQQKWLLLN